MLVVDAHCHLHEQPTPLTLWSTGADRECAMQCKCVINGTHPSDWGPLARYCATRGELFPAYGVHPWYVEQLPEGWLDDLRQRMEDPRASIGEIGLDFSPGKPDRALQEAVFVLQVKLAREINRPVSIHGVKAWDRVLKLLQMHGAPKRGFLLHAYSGGEENAASFAAIGAFFGVSMRAIKRAIKGSSTPQPLLPFDRILPESDARVGAPTSCSSALSLRRSTDSVGEIYETLSSLYGVSKETLAERLATSFNVLFERL